MWDVNQGPISRCPILHIINNLYRLPIGDEQVHYFCWHTFVIIFDSLPKSVLFILCSELELILHSQLFCNTGCFQVSCVLCFMKMDCVNTDDTDSCDWGFLYKHIVQINIFLVITKTIKINTVLQIPTLDYALILTLESQYVLKKYNYFRSVDTNFSRAAWLHPT